MIVFDDADIEAVVEGVRTLAITMPDRIVLRLVGSTRKKDLRYAGGKTRCCGGNVKIGFPDDESTELGPLSSLAHLERVARR